MAEAICGQKHTERRSRSPVQEDQKSNQGLKIMPVVEGEWSPGGSAAQQILF